MADNRYWIKTKRPGESEWGYVSDCGEGMKLPEMALQLIDVIRLQGAGFGRLRCFQGGATRPAAENVLVLSNKMLDQERARWQRKYECEQKAGVS